MELKMTSIPRFFNLCDYKYVNCIDEIRIVKCLCAFYFKITKVTYSKKKSYIKEKIIFSHKLMIKKFSLLPPHYEVTRAS